MRQRGGGGRKAGGAVGPLRTVPGVRRAGGATTHLGMHAIVALALVWLIVAADREAAPLDARCQAAWQAADVDRDGVLDGREATPYLALLHLHRVNPPADGRIERSGFLAHCAAGAFRTGYLPGDD